jgi:hypothetical protein
MFEWARRHLDIRASDEWGYDVMEADPVVQLLIGACAAEAKSIYDSIQETEDRLHRRLLRYLLPEAFLFPQPAYGIARAQPTVSACQLSASQEFKTLVNDQVFSFCPLFETTLLGGQVRFIGLDSRVIESRPGSPYRSDTGPETVSRVLLGIETKQVLASLENVALYFDWRGALTERQAFLQALSNGHWTCNGKELRQETGLYAGPGPLAEQFQTESRLVRHVAAQYRLQFHVITQSDLAPALKDSVPTVLTQWLGAPPPMDPANPSGQGSHFTWIRVDLPAALQLTDVERNLVADINHFPVANRRLLRKADQGTYFSKSLGFEATVLDPAEGHFCGIQSVIDLETGEEIPPVVFSKLIGEERDRPGYSLRYGGAGRYDNLNAWERLSYILGLLRQEHKDREVIESLGLKLTLEEVHEVLGKRMLKGLSQNAGQERTPPAYLFFRLGRSPKLDAEVRYWITNGDEANRIPAGALLYAEPPIPGIDPASPRFVTETTGGKTTVSETEQTQLLQDSLFRRERIVTAHDIKSLCRKMLGDHLLEVTIQPFFQPDGESRGGIRRAIEVNVKVDEAGDVHLHQIGQEIETILQENSIGTVPYRVRLC